jgi:hypothetical protein
MLILPRHYDERIKPRLGSRLDTENPINQGLVGYWLMNEGGGNTILDASGNRNSGVLQADAHWVGGRFGPAISMDGTGDGILVADAPVLRPTQGITISAWLTPTDVTYIGIVSKWDLSESGYGDWTLYLGNGTLILRLNNSKSVIGVIALSVGVPYHLVGVYDCVSARLYVNGVLDVSSVYTSTLAAHTYPLWLGQYNSGGAGSGLKGTLDGVAIYNRALTANEIRQLYVDPYAGIQRSSLNLWLGAMGGGAGGTAYTKTINDGVGVTDAFARACQFSRILTESVGTTDALGKASVAIRAMSDAIGLTDALSKGETKVFSDALGIVDSLIRVWEATRSFAETLGTTDGLTKDETKVLTDSLGLTDVPVSVSVVLRTVADTVGVTDNLSSVWDALRTITESLGITDAMSEIFEGSGAFVRTINDAVGLSDSMVAIQILLRVMTENLGMADAVASVLATSRIISDAEGITDGIVLGRMMAVSDTLGITDDLTRLVRYLRTQNDAEGLLDSVARVVVALRTVNDTVGMTDAMSRQFGALLKAVWAFMLLKHKR